MTTAIVNADHLRGQLDTSKAMTAQQEEAVASQEEQLRLCIAHARRRETALQEDVDQTAAASNAKDRQIEASGTLIDHLRDELEKAKATSVRKDEAMATLEDQLRLSNEAAAQLRDAAFSITPPHTRGAEALGSTPGSSASRLGHLLLLPPQQNLVAKQLASSSAALADWGRCGLSARLYLRFADPHQLRLCGPGC